MKTVAGRRLVGTAPRRSRPTMSLPIVIFVVLGGATAAGLWLGWPALVAAGIAPILIGLAPCAVMCALGLCVGGLGTRALRQSLGADEQRPLGKTSGQSSLSASHPDLDSRVAMSCCDEPEERVVEQNSEPIR